MKSKILILSGLPGTGKSTFRNKILKYDRTWNIIDNDEIRKDLYNAKEIKTKKEIILKGLEEEYKLIVYVLNKSKRIKINKNIKEKLTDYINKFKVSINRLKEFVERITNNTENQNKEYVLELRTFLSDNQISTQEFLNLLKIIEKELKLLPDNIKYKIYTKIPHTRNKEVFDIYYKKIIDGISNDKKLIIDGNNLFVEHINKIPDFLKKYNKKENYLIYLITWWNVPLKTVIKRNKDRKLYQKVPEDVVYRMNNSLKKIKNHVDKLQISKNNTIDVSNLNLIELENLIKEKFIENNISNNLKYF